MTTIALHHLTQMIQDLPASKQDEVKDYVETLWAESRRHALRDSEKSTVREANQRVLSLLEQWQADLSKAESLDDFDEFQAAHPIRPARLLGDA